jgi:hypothetical protein
VIAERRHTASSAAYVRSTLRGLRPCLACSSTPQTGFDD